VTTKSVPAPPPTRELRGLALYHEHHDEIEHIGHGVYTVPGCTGGTYTVDLSVFGGEESCTCPDHRRHPEHSCKHIICATLYRSKARAAARKEQRPRFDSASVEANLARIGS
jgi:uncharacterized Zn finger protein